MRQADDVPELVHQDRAHRGGAVRSLDDLPQDRGVQTDSASDLGPSPGHRVAHTVAAPQADGTAAESRDDVRGGPGDEHRRPSASVPSDVAEWSVLERLLVGVTVTREGQSAGAAYLRQGVVEELIGTGRRDPVVDDDVNRQTRVVGHRLVRLARLVRYKPVGTRLRHRDRRTGSATGADPIEVHVDPLCVQHVSRRHNRDDGRRTGDEEPTSPVGASRGGACLLGIPTVELTQLSMHVSAATRRTEGQGVPVSPPWHREIMPTPVSPPLENGREADREAHLRAQ